MSTQETAGDAGVFSNENISVAVIKLPHCTTKLDVTVQPKAVEAAYARAVKNVKKEVTVPGFRKGKAPDHFVFERYGSAIDKEWKDVVVQTGFNESLHLADLSPLKNGYISRPVLHECSKDKGAKFTVEFESRPTIPSIEFAEITLKKGKRPAITDTDRDNALHNFALQFTTYEEVHDRPVQEGDFVNLNVDLLDEGMPKRIIDNQRTQVSDKGLPSWILKKVIGLKSGDSAEGISEQTPGKEDPDYKPVPYRITVQTVLQGNMPAYNDELAEKAGLKTLEELKKRIDQGIAQNIEEEAENEEYRELLRKLSEHYTFDIPLSIIEGNLENRLEEYKKTAAKNKTGPDNLAEIKSLLRQQIENELRLVFIFRKTAAENNIEVLSEDIHDELNRQISLISSGRNTINFQGDKDEVRDRLHNLALDRKIKNYILERITYVEE